MTVAVASGLTPVFEGGVEANLDRFCIWVVSPPGYVHSEAFAEIAEGLSGGLTELGGSAPVVRSPDRFDGRTPIVLGANLLDLDSALVLPEDAIIFNLEQVDGASTWFSPDYLRLLATHRVLDYSVRNRDALRRLGVRHAELLEIGHADVLDRIVATPLQDIDVLFYGSMNPRRRAIVEALEDQGLEVRHLFGVYGADRDDMIARSKIVLNVHFYGSRVFEIVRASYLLSNGVCVVTEGDPTDPDLSDLADAMVVGAYEDLPGLCRSLVADHHRRKERSQAARTAMHGRRQADCWRRAFEGSGPSNAGRGVEVVAETPLSDVDHVTFLCPIGVTGGPEAIHQVSQMLRSLGLGSDIMYFGNGAELAKRGLELVAGESRSNACLTAYAGYEPICTDRVRYGAQRLLIVPELLAAQAPAFSPFRTAIWWLSVDNALVAGRPLADQRVLTALMGDRTILHLHQSAYAREFVRSKGASSFPLGDFTDQSFVADSLPITERSPTVAYYPFKGGELAREFFAAHPDLEGVAIEGMTKEQVAELFSRVMFFVDFGHFPGKDRMPREAAVAGALVMLRSAGAGRFLEDFPLPDLYRFDDGDVRSGELYRRIRNIAADPSHHWTQQGFHRQTVIREREVLRTQLASLFGR